MIVEERGEILPRKTLIGVLASRYRGVQSNIPLEDFTRDRFVSENTPSDGKLTATTDRSKTHK